MVKLSVGDFVLANRVLPVMKIIAIRDKKATCEWTVNGKKRQKIYFLTELRKDESLKPKKVIALDSSPT